MNQELADLATGFLLFLPYHASIMPSFYLGARDLILSLYAFVQIFYRLSCLPRSLCYVTIKTPIQHCFTASYLCWIRKLASHRVSVCAM